MNAGIARLFRELSGLYFVEPALWVGEFLEQQLSLLPERDRMIVMWYFGIGNNGQMLTLSEIAQRLGVSRARAHQIKNRAMRRLRIAMDKAARGD